MTGLLRRPRLSQGDNVAGSPSRYLGASYLIGPRRVSLRGKIHLSQDPGLNLRALSLSRVGASMITQRDQEQEDAKRLLGRRESCARGALELVRYCRLMSQHPGLPQAGNSEAWQCDHHSWVDQGVGLLWVEKRPWHDMIANAYLIFQVCYMVEYSTFDQLCYTETPYRRSHWAWSPLTSSSYLAALLILSDFPYLIMTRNTRQAAIPTNAAEMKQFWYPRFVSHGVMLTTC